MQIRIIAVPPGEAPEAVRKAWVGLCLPLVDANGDPETVQTAGVLTGPKTFFAKVSALVLGRNARTTGYRVPAPAAFDILARHSPEAASWWHTHSPTRDPRRQLVFRADVCELVDDGPGFVAP